MPMRSTTEADDTDGGADERSGDGGFGERMRRLRELRGYKSQAAFARQLGLSNMTVNRHETGKRLPLERELKLYARALRTTEEHLLYGVGNGDIPPAVEAYIAEHQYDLHPAAAQMLRRMPWETMCPASQPDEIDVATVRQTIDALLRKRGHSGHDQPGGIPAAGRVVSRQQPGRKDTGRSRRETA
jgi:transcriptional regulator with XRE-family HTH domain